jgi:hypothetical protein
MPTEDSNTPPGDMNEVSDPAAELETIDEDTEPDAPDVEMSSELSSDQQAISICLSVVISRCNKLMEDVTIENCQKLRAAIDTLEEELQTQGIE